MKRLFDPLLTAWTTMVTHKLRSVLTILGVVIGVSCVIILMAIGQGTQVTINDSLNTLGPNLIYVMPGSANQTSIGRSSGSTRALTLEDAQAIAADVTNINAVAPSSTIGMQVIAGNQNMYAQITGVTPDYQRVNNTEVVGGDFITQDEYNAAARIALIGPTVSTTLFGVDDPVGQTIRAGNSILHITGVLESKGGSLSSNDDAILIPLSTLQGMSLKLTTTGQHEISSISVQAADENSAPAVKSAIISLLKSRHLIAEGEDNDFTVISMDEISDSINTAMSSITILLSAIAGISLLVGGIGVMNIMLVSVLERRREIGIRKALGAKGRDIWGQFLIDAIVLTFTGGIIGVIIGWGGSYLVSTSGLLTTVVTSGTVVLAFGVSVGIGIFFGFLPAWQASRLDPIQALRSE
ncbi:MAG: ABC transporter permease [Dehalococcoidales bacterium]|nr:ABC transporter permease [Dehalococcoidales bacterium]